MCGFFGINNVNNLLYDDFDDVKERGLKHFSKSHKNFYSFQSVLPCTGNYSGEKIYENENYIFNYTGEIYNYDRYFNNDTEYLFQLINKHDNWDFIDNLNGMFAISVYDKNTNSITLIRDSIGQIPLFYYNKDCLIYSNTLPSLVKNSSAKINSNAFDNWLTTKHYIFQETFWKDVNLFPKGMIITFDKNGNVSYERKIVKKKSNDNRLHQLLDSKVSDYTSRIDCGSIFSGGVDSSIISKFYDNKSKYVLGVNNIGKDYISNDVEDFQKYFKNKINIVNVAENIWVETVTELIGKLYTVPYSWSWVGYYLMSKTFSSQDIHVCLTGEGADEVFGGYNYNNQLSNRSLKRTDCESLNSYIQEKNKFNRMLDKEMFVPIGCIGANLTMGTHCVEPRNPFLDHDIFYNNFFENDVNKNECKKIFNLMFPKIEIKPKQGFAGFPNELYAHLGLTEPEITNNDENYKWKKACYEILKNL